MIHIASEKSASTLSNVSTTDIQPNAVDLKVSKILRISDNVFTIDEEQKIHRGSKSVEVQEDGYWNLEPGSYEVVMENIIEVGEGEAGFVITRSTLNRNGVHITTGLYDSGYHGSMAAVLHVNCGVMRIKPGTRIGQYLSFKSETLSLYDGDYGLAKEHDQKYALVD